MPLSAQINNQDCARITWANLTIVALLYRQSMTVRTTIFSLVALTCFKLLVTVDKAKNFYVLLQDLYGNVKLPYYSIRRDRSRCALSEKDMVYSRTSIPYLENLRTSTFYSGWAGKRLISIPAMVTRQSNEKYYYFKFFLSYYGLYCF